MYRSGELMYIEINSENLLVDVPKSLAIKTFTMMLANSRIREIILAFGRGRFSVNSLEMIGQ